MACSFSGKEWEMISWVLKTTKRQTIKQRIVLICVGHIVTEVSGSLVLWYSFIANTILIMIDYFLLFYQLPVAFRTVGISFFLCTIIIKHEALTTQWGNLSTLAHIDNTGSLASMVYIGKETLPDVADSIVVCLCDRFRGSVLNHDWCHQTVFRIFSLVSLTSTLIITAQYVIGRPANKLSEKLSR